MRITKPGRTPRPAADYALTRTRISLTDPDLPALIAAGLRDAAGWSL